jgi:phosphatidylinositol dimannoside acyltransferase
VDHLRHRTHVEGGSGADERPAVRPHFSYRGSGLPGQQVHRNPGATSRLPAEESPPSWRARRTTLLWTVLWECARRLPEALVFAVAAAAGSLAYRTVPVVRGRVRENLRRVVGGERLEEVTRQAFRSYARYWIEAFRAADIGEERTHERTTTAGFRHLDGVLDEGRGAIVLLAHHGSWDMAARWAESHGYHLAVVAEVLRPRALFARFVRLREAVGLEVVPLERGERSDGRIAARLGAVLDANHLVGLLTDRDLRGRAPRVPFFGEPTSMPVGAAVLACRRGTPIVPITMLQRPHRRWHLQILPPIRAAGRSVAEVHADVARALESLIRLDPTQWHAFQPVWPADGGRNVAGGNT